jgi:hypothetical protein
MNPEVAGPIEDVSPGEDFFRVEIDSPAEHQEAVTFMRGFGLGVSAGMIAGCLGTLIILEHLESPSSSSKGHSDVQLPEAMPSQQAHVRNIALQLRIGLLPHNMDSVSVLKLQRLEGELEALSPAEIARCRNIFDQASPSGKRVSDIAIDWLDAYRGQERTARRECIENILTILGYDTRKNLVEL